MLHVLEILKIHPREPPSKKYVLSSQISNLCPLFFLYILPKELGEAEDIPPGFKSSCA